MALSALEVLYNEALGEVGAAEIEDSAPSRALPPNQICVKYYEQARDEVLSCHPWNEAMVQVIILEDTTEPTFGYDARYSLPSGQLRIISVDSSTGADVRNNASNVFPWEIQGDYIFSDAGQQPQTWATATNYNTNEYVSTTPVTFVSGTAYIDGQYVKSSTLVYEVLNDYTATTIAADITAGNLGAGKVATTGTYLVAGTYTSSSAILTDIANGDLTPAGAGARIVYVEYVQQLTDTSKYSSKLRQAIVMKLAIKIVVGLVNDRGMKADLINEFEQLTIRNARSFDAMQMKPKPIFSSGWVRSRWSGMYGR